MKRALVTGGARRIGAVLARRLAELDFAVWVHCRHSQPEAEELIAALPNPGTHRVTICDFAAAEDVESWLATLPEFEVVVNNASLYRLTRPGVPETPEMRAAYQQVNVTVPLLLTGKVRSGVIINLLDSDALAPDGGILPAAELPAGMDSYLETRKLLARKTLELAQRLAPHVRVNGIAPGAVLPPAECQDGGMRKILAQIPLAHPAALAELADALELLVKSPSLTGVILPVDGGKHLRVR